MLECERQTRTALVTDGTLFSHHPGESVPMLGKHRPTELQLSLR